MAEGKKLIITICGRAGSAGFKNKNLKEFCRKPLAHYSLAAIELFLKRRPDLEADIVLNTDSGLLRDLVLGAYPEVEYVHRPPELAGGEVAKMQVFQQSLRVMEEKKGYKYDVHMDLDITSPLRTVADVQGTFEALETRPDLDLVMSAARSRRNPFMNMFKRVGDHVEQVIPNETVARQNAPVCYDINASVYAFRRDFLAANIHGRLWEGKCDVYEMMDTGILDIDSEEDFILMEVIAGHLFRTDPAFAEVRDAIR